MVRILEALEFEVRVDKETGKQVDQETRKQGNKGAGEQGNKDGALVYLSTCLLVTVPSHRQDVNIPADLVEEIGRIYGYDRLAPTLLEDELPPQRRNVALEGEEKVRDILAGAGLDEVITYSMIDVRDEAKLVGRGLLARGLAGLGGATLARGNPGRATLAGQPRPYRTSPCSTRSPPTAATCAGRCCRAC